MEWISLKVCPRSHFDGQGDVSHLPTRLAETEAPVLPLCPLRARSIPSGSRKTFMCAPQPPSNLSPLACQSQKQKTSTSTSNLKEKSHLLCQKAGGSRPFIFNLCHGSFPWCVAVLSALYCYIYMKKNLYNPNTLLRAEHAHVKTCYHHSHTALLKSKAFLPTGSLNEGNKQHFCVVNLCIFWKATLYH